jgi:hypothetical protein
MTDLHVNTANKSSLTLWHRKDGASDGGWVSISDQTTPLIVSAERFGQRTGLLPLILQVCLLQGRRVEREAIEDDIVVHEVNLGWAKAGEVDSPRHVHCVCHLAKEIPLILTR